MFKLVYKDKGKSSFKAIKEYASLNNIKKIGHTGTLDPLAQGLLLIATDDDTKLIQYIRNKDKEYIVELKLGYISKTYDAEGPIEKISKFQPSIDDIKKVLSEFIGKIKQKPPIFSAKKINGKRAYELARNNDKFEIKEIDVEIYSIWDIQYNYPFLKFKTLVSNGTYIRSLVNDIGNKLKTGAYMTFLERTMVNGLRTNDVIDIKKITKLESIKINNKKTLKEWFDGKIKEYNLKDNLYLLEYENNIIGIVGIKNQKLKLNLFGNKIQKILKEA